jgi:hypothetical protein
MSILPISMSHVSDPPKIDYTDAMKENTYYKAHAGYSFNIAGKMKAVHQFVFRLTRLAKEQAPKPILKTNQSPL